MRVAPNITLSDSEKKALEKPTRSRAVSIRLAERSHIVLLAAAGLENKVIAQRLKIPPTKVGKWRSRFVEGGLLAISKEKPRGDNHGGPACLRHKIIQATMQTKPANATHWSTRTLADALKTTHSFVHRV